MTGSQPELSAHGRTYGRNMLGSKPEGQTLRRKRQRHSLPPLHFVTINVRSLLCDDSPGLAETARTTVFRQEMTRRSFALVMVQETKMDKKYVFDCDEFMVAATSPVAGVGGLQILLAKNKALRILWTREFSPRVLAVAFAWGKEKWCAINAYMPTSAAPHHIYEEQFQYVLKAWALAKQNGLPIITGCDLNARLGGLRDDIHIGSAVTGGLQPEMKVRAALIAEGLQDNGLAAWSTLIGEPHTTWISPHGTEAQLDYLIGDFAKCKRVANIAIAHLDNIPSDHKMVWGELLPSDPALSKPIRLRPKPCKVKGQDHDLAIRLALVSADHSNWKGNDNPVDAMNA
eukprot:1553989-Amphidinium_carterae.1